MAAHRELRVQEQEISPAPRNLSPAQPIDTHDLEVQRHAVIQFQESYRLICAGEIWGPIKDFPQIPLAIST